MEEGPGPVNQVETWCRTGDKKVPIPEVFYEHGHGPDNNLWRGTCSFLDQQFEVEAISKKAAKTAICMQILAHIPQDQLKSEARRRHGGRGNRERRGEERKERRKKDSREIFVFLDLERTSGHLHSPPFSYGMVATHCGSQPFLSELEEVILPDQKIRRDDPSSKHAHKMYVEENGKEGRRVMKSGGKGGKAWDVPLSSVSPKTAAKKFIEFLKGYKDCEVYVFFHGPDEQCLLGFMRDHGHLSTFQELVTAVLDTQGYFKEEQRKSDRQWSLRAIVEDFCPDEDFKTNFKSVHHGALNDARALALCASTCGKELFDFYEEEITSTKLKARHSDYIIYDSRKGQQVKEEKLEKWC